jgi:hypothetical protein
MKEARVVSNQSSYMIDGVQISISNAERMVCHTAEMKTKCKLNFRVDVFERSQLCRLWGRPLRESLEDFVVNG